MYLNRTVSLILLASLLNVSAFAAEKPAVGCGDQSKLAPDKRVANTPKWTTASESDNFGYDVYRGDGEKGPFAKLTKQPILGAGTTDETHKYQFVDDTIDPCKDYWYYVEAISTHGARETFTPVFKAPAKRLPNGKPAPPAPKEKAVAPPAHANPLGTTDKH